MKVRRILSLAAAAAVAVALSAPYAALGTTQGAAKAQKPADAPNTATAIPAAPVLLKPRAVVNGDVVRLGDLFEGTADLSDATVARAPEPGRRVEVEARWLAAVAHAYGLHWRPKSRFDSITVERSSLVIETAQIESATLDALVARGATGRVSIIFDNPALRLHLPTDATASMAVAALSYDPANGRFTGQVIAPAEGTPLVRASISGRAVQMTDVPTLVQRIEPGEIIGRRHLQWISVRADRLTRNTVNDENRLIGKSPRRPIRAGEPILASDLREPILVEKNSTVTIRLETPRMILTAQGRSLDQGAAGDVIRVMNTHSKKIINATVEKSGDVRVFAATLAGIEQESR